MLLDIQSGLDAQLVLDRVANRTRSFDFTAWVRASPIAFDGLVESTELLAAGFEKGMRLAPLGASTLWQESGLGYMSPTILISRIELFSVSACSWTAPTPGEDTDFCKSFCAEVNV